MVFLPISRVQAFANLNTKVMLAIPTGFCAPIISDALTGLVDGVADLAKEGRKEGAQAGQTGQN